MNIQGNTYLAHKILECRIYPIDMFTSNMIDSGFGRWSVDVGDMEVPFARAYYDKLCNVASWADLEGILCRGTGLPAGMGRSDTEKCSELRTRAVRIVEQINGSIARAL